MKAILFPKYNSFESLVLIEKDVPHPGAKEVIVKVKNSALNALDWHVMRGMTLVKFKCGLINPKKKYQTLGADISGEVVEVGSEVTQFKKGDEVFGDIFTGGFAEYTIAPQKKIIKKPKELSFEQAAASPVAGQTAMQAIKHACNIQKGDHVLINGASGGVGTYCVQIAKYYGAEVTAVCSSQNHELVKSLGADYLIDYNTEDFCKQDIQYDWVIEVVGNRTPKEIKKVLKPNAKCAVVGFHSAKNLMRHMFSFSKKFKMVSFDCTQEQLEELAKVLVDGKIEAPITERYKLKDVPNGIKKLSTKRSVGKMIVENE